MNHQGPQGGRTVLPMPTVNWPSGLRADLKPAVMKCIDAFNQSISEGGVPYALGEHRRGGAYVSGQAGRMGAPLVTVVPGDGHVACTPIVSGFASGSGSGAKGFRGVSRAIRRRLIDCMGHVEVAVIFTDCWDSRLIAESIEDFRAHHQRGVHLMIFLAHAGGVSQVDPGL